MNNSQDKNKGCFETAFSGIFGIVGIIFGLICFLKGCSDGAFIGFFLG